MEEIAKTPDNPRLKKVLLVFPPVVYSQESLKQITPPLGLGYLASYIEDEFTVEILDAALEGYNCERPAQKKGFLIYGLEMPRIKERIRESGADVVGVSCLYSSQFSQAQAVCRAAKEISARIITVIGGTHPTFLPEQCLVTGSIDFIVRGEGEAVFKELLCRLRDGLPVNSQQGIAYLEQGKVRINPEQKLIADLDSIPFPRRSPERLKKYFRIGLPMGLVFRREPFVSMITSRGCLNRCSFCSSCSFWRFSYRGRSAENVLEEMAELKKLGIKEIKFFDDNLTQDRERAKNIFRGMIERKFEFSWNVPNGIDMRTLDEEMIGLMKQSGCYELTFAFESGDEKVLRDIVNKPLDLGKARETVKMVKRHGLDTYGFFIIGFPGETREQILNTLRFIREVRLDRISLLLANPLPGTRLYDVCREGGYFSFVDSDFVLDYFSSRFETGEFDSGFLERTRRRFYWSYNLSLFFRNPFKFVSKYSIFIFKKPYLLIETLLKKFLIPSVKSE